MAGLFFPWGHNILEILKLTATPWTKDVDY